MKHNQKLRVLVVSFLAIASRPQSSVAEIAPGGYANAFGCLVYFLPSGEGFCAAPSWHLHNVPDAECLEWKERDGFLELKLQGRNYPPAKILPSDPSILALEIGYDTSEGTGEDGDFVPMPPSNPVTITNAYSRSFTYTWNQGNNSMLISFESLKTIDCPIETVFVLTGDSICLEYSITNIVDSLLGDILWRPNAISNGQSLEQPYLRLDRKHLDSATNAQSPVKAETIDVAISGVDSSQHDLWIFVRFERDNFLCAFVPKLEVQQKPLSSGPRTFRRFSGNSINGDKSDFD